MSKRHKNRFIINDMQNSITLHEGETLRVLIKRAGIKVEDAARTMGLAPNSLSRLFKSEKLTNKVKLKACVLLGVDESIFRATASYGYPEITPTLVEEDESDESMRRRYEELMAENRRLAEELLREQGISEGLRQALKELRRL